MSIHITPEIEEQLSQLILERIAALPRAGASIDPAEIARECEPDDHRRWMEPVREIARRLAERGEIEVVRHGKPVEGWPWRGVIRFRAARGGRFRAARAKPDETQPPTQEP